MEGGTRTEFLYALLASATINLIATGAALVAVDLALAGLITAVVGVGLGIATWSAISNYIAGRVRVYGPWSTDDPRY
ncbi:hypothetical protein [Microbacterium lacticum]